MTEKKKRTRRTIGKNLFNPDREYKMNSESIQLKFLRTKTFTIDHMLGIGRYLVP